MRSAVIVVALLALAACDDRAPPPPPPPPPDAGPDTGPRRDAGVILECLRDSDCATGVCRGFAGELPRDRAALLLGCGAPEPERSAVGASCISRTECDRELCAFAGACVAPCVEDSDCDVSEACREVWVTTGADAMQSTSACTARFAVADDVSVEGPTLGPPVHVMGVEDTLESLAPNALVAWRVPALEQHVFITSIDTRDAPPVRLFAGFPSGTSAAAPTWGIGDATLGELTAIRFPNGPLTPSSPTGYTVGLATEMTSTSERVILRRTGVGTTIDIDAYLLGGMAWESPDGSMPPAMAEAMEGADALLATVGLHIGDVRVHDARGFLRARFSIVESRTSTDLREIFRLSAGATRPSVHVFFVRLVAGALGVSAGIVGAQGMPGTGASGVAISTDAVPPELMPSVLVHEIGHFLGLFHVSEFNGAVYEPLTDTPECRTDRDADGNGTLTTSECDGAGADNVMFYSGAGSTISAQQADVMRSAYVVR